MQSPRISYYIVNGVTMCRLVSAPFLLLLAIMGLYEWYKWCMAASFFTDAIDGPLSRRYHVESVFGSRLDSVADDVTVIVSAVALWLFYPEFIKGNWIVIAGLFALFGIQTVAALVAYKKVTSFHTYLAKIAAVTQAAFFIAFFFKIGLIKILFILAVVITALQLVEEIILVIMLPQWTANVKGVYWIWRTRTQIAHSKQSGMET
ncbi:CDP-alcohol phosphatidyltransferase family protein [Ohtaekwangia kribbensis]|jgi:phosphatidylglycerophosphate synthase|uniref:CDP-alcohol phosphatidyltransferase family protein n=1 Tax=Ohtaekwangia kribbensis TaxID=688913 RepID=A0ABW3JVV8_9BACT